nr:hypothetical protein Iba_chr10cCG0440 [Ipomoea batatas]
MLSSNVSFHSDVSLLSPAHPPRVLYQPIISPVHVLAVPDGGDAVVEHSPARPREHPALVKLEREVSGVNRDGNRLVRHRLAQRFLVVLRDLLEAGDARGGGGGFLGVAFVVCGGVWDPLEVTDLSGLWFFSVELKMESGDRLAFQKKQIDLRCPITASQHDGVETITRFHACLLSSFDRLLPDFTNGQNAKDD